MGALAEGTLIGPYRVISAIGRGGMGTVYRAYQQTLERDVAIKVVDSSAAQDPEFIERFRREARLIANLRHPNILPVYDFGMHDGMPYLVMEYVPGGALIKCDLRSLPMGERRQIAHDIASAIDFAHQHGIMHRDVKPDNILLSEDGRAVLGDFGLARLEGSATQLTSAGALLGSPRYMSPEQALGHSADMRSDLYAFGMILYELVAGEPPFKADTPVALLYAHVHQAPPPPSQFNSEISAEIDAAALKAIAKDPQERYPTAREAAEAVLPQQTVVRAKPAVTVKAILIGAAVETLVLTIAFIIWYLIAYGVLLPPAPPAGPASTPQVSATQSLPKPPFVPGPQESLQPSTTPRQ